MALATSSLPVPDSPLIKTGVLTLASFPITLNTFCIEFDSPTNLSSFESPNERVGAENAVVSTIDLALSALLIKATRLSDVIGFSR